MSTRAIVAAFLEGMYYAGKLPSRAEITAIAMRLQELQLTSEKRLTVENIISQEMDDLHRRVHPAMPEKGE